MTDQPTPDGTMPTGVKRFVPSLRSRWWTLLLGASLMLNLLIGGIVLGNRFGHGERFVGANMVQLLPRQFLRELPRDRRRELLEEVRQSAGNAREVRQIYATRALQLADVLEQSDPKPTDIAAALDGFSADSQAIVARSATAVRDTIAKLTPDERKTLATALRNRAAATNRGRKSDQ
jgi:hypothetical protein